MLNGASVKSPDLIPCTILLSVKPIHHELICYLLRIFKER